MEILVKNDGVLKKKSQKLSLPLGING